jgi:hypothetical protein
MSSRRGGSHGAKIGGALASLALGVALASCGSGGDCVDGVDNDRDGRIDGFDPACAAGFAAETPDPQIEACQDGVDNDGDGKIDAVDPGCDGARDGDEQDLAVAACQDGLDNDGDGKLDAPDDPGCAIALDADERDDCPVGADCPRCSDGHDDDGDGAADYPADLGCDSAADEDESTAVFGACGAAPLRPLPGSGIAIGAVEVRGINALASPTCSGIGDEIVYAVALAEPSTLRATTALPDTVLDTVLYVRSACQDPGTELGCNDDLLAAGPRARGSSLEVALPEGDYYLVVDARSREDHGVFRLEVAIEPTAAPPP